jgi:uncharacterized protein (UPF0333 family)
MRINNNAQSLLEYVIVVGAVVLIMFAMGPMLKRGTQSLIKIVADQIGSQRNADQSFDEGGHMESMYFTTRGSQDKETVDLLGNITYIYDDVIMTTTSTVTNLGFTEED